MADYVVPKEIIKINDVPAVFTDNKPIVFWDTCSLLYFITLVDRRAYREYEWDVKLFHLVEEEKVYSVTSSIVLQEFNSHYADCRDKDKEREDSLKAAMASYGAIIGGDDEIKLQNGMNALNLSTHLDQMVCRIWENTYVIEENPLFQQMAHNRVLAKTPPSSEKQQYKDCYIWETFLALCDQSLNKGISYFMTENTEDYCGKKSKTPLPDIENDLMLFHGSLLISKSQLWVSLAKFLKIIP